MNVLRQHVTHHRKHVVGCGLAGLGVVIGVFSDLPALAISAAIVCGAFCLSMVRMMITTGLNARHR
jgi:hypothetical protein